MMFESDGDGQGAPACFPCKREVTTDTVEIREVDGALQIHVRGMGTIHLSCSEMDALTISVLKFYAALSVARAAVLYGGPRT